MNSSRCALFFSLAYHPSFGGTENQCKLLAEKLALRRPVQVITRRLPNTKKDEIINGVPVHRIWIPSLPVLSWLVFAFQMIFILITNRRRISAVICMMFNTPSLIISFLCRLLHLPVIVKPSAGGPDGNLDKVLRTPLGSFKVDQLNRWLNMLVSINPQITDEFVRIGLSAKKIRPIPNGVDADLLKPITPEEKANARRIRDIPADVLMGLFVGRLEDVKNLPTLLTAWKKVCAEHPDAVLYLVGEGSAYPSLEAQVHQLNLVRNVIFVGRKEAFDYFKAADLFLLPSHREGVSNALLEAMSSGLPVVASEIPANSSLISHERDGWLCRTTDADHWAEAINRLFRHPDLRAKAGAEARKKVETTFSIDRVASDYENLLQICEQPAFGKAFPILAYHRIPTEPKYAIDIRLVEFEKQMTWLHAKGYTTIPLHEVAEIVAAGKALPHKKVILTFDDAHRDVYENARPILDRYGFKAVIFANTGLLGKKYWVTGRGPEKTAWHASAPEGFQDGSNGHRLYEFMSWDQLKEMSRAGHEIESHGVTHPFLTRLAPPALEMELRESKRSLEEGLKKPVNYFCYPSGDTNEAVETAAAQAGYKGAVLTANHYDLEFQWTRPYELERIGLWRDVSFRKFKWLVTGCYSRFRTLLPSVLWTGLRKISLLYK